MTFPEPARKYISQIPVNGGKLAYNHCKTLLDLLQIESEALMLRLLPVAKLYAVTPISRFPVGAVVCAKSSEARQSYDLYLGANIEFSGVALNQTVHAEQAAVVNAWHGGAVEIQSIAASAAPCGHCRQFLNELENGHTLDIITETGKTAGWKAFKLTDLLPKAFGPKSLSVTAGLMASSKQRQPFALNLDSNAPLILKALSAAEKSYAPYSKNYAGCAIQMKNGQIFDGRYVENAAFNPSLSPLQSAIICMNMGNIADDHTISRLVLVEQPTDCRQREVTELVLKSVAPEVKLEYYKVV